MIRRTSSFASMVDGQIGSQGGQDKDNTPLGRVYNSIFNSAKEISMHLRYSTGKVIYDISDVVVNRLGTKNKFGDEKLDMEVQTDDLVRENLKKSKAV
jgi:hypothetical protein